LQVDCQRSPKSWSLNLTIAKILGEPLAIDQITTQLPDYLVAKKTELTLSRISESDISIDSDGRVSITGPFQFDKQGDGFSIEASIV